MKLRYASNGLDSSPHTCTIGICRFTTNSVETLFCLLLLFFVFFMCSYRRWKFSKFCMWKFISNFHVSTGEAQFMYVKLRKCCFILL